MNTLEIPEKEISIEVPAHWDEMDPDQLRQVLNHAAAFTSGRISYEDFLLRSFYKLAGIRRSWTTLAWERLVGQEVVAEKDANAYLLAKEYCAFILRENEAAQLEINYDTVVNHFPILRVAGRPWYGPADLLSDLTFAEFRAALEEMNEYFREKDPDALLRMIACLYRPVAADQDPERIPTRAPFDRTMTVVYSRRLTRVPEWQRLGIVLWFTWCIHYVQSEPLMIEGKEISFKALFPKEDSGSSSLGPVGLGWTGILYAIAKEGVFGDIEKTEKASLFDVLLYMYDNYLQKKRNAK